MGFFLKKRKIFSILGIFFIFGFLTFFSILASKFWDPLWNPFREKPEDVFAKMLSKIQEIETLESKIAFSFQGENKGKIKISFKSLNKQDWQEKDHPKGESDFKILGYIKGESFLGLKFILEGKIKNFGKISYLKLEKLPSFLEELRGKWIKIDQDSIKEFLKEKASPKVSSQMEEFFEKREKEDAILKKELEEKLKKIFAQRKLFVIEKEFKDEKFQNLKVYHYLISLNQKEFLKLIFEILEILEKRYLELYGISPFFEKKALKMKIKEFLEKIGKLEAEIWIGKKDYLPYRLKAKKKINLENFGQKGTLLIKYEILNLSFNQTFKIEPPKEFKTLKEILEVFFQKEILPTFPPK